MDGTLTTCVCSSVLRLLLFSSLFDDAGATAGICVPEPSVSYFSSLDLHISLLLTLCLFCLY